MFHQKPLSILACIFVAVLATPPALHAQFGAPRVISPTQKTQTDVFVRDMDGDMDLDVVAAGISGTGLYENNGAGVFAEAHVFPSGSAASAVVGDLDGNGFMDVVVAVSGNLNPTGNSTFVVYLNQLNWNFQDVEYAAGSPDLFELALMDVDDDGDLDLLCSGGANEPTRLFDNNGAGSFSSGGFLLGSSFGPIFNLVADLDGDSDDDLVYSWNTAPSGSVEEMGWVINGPTPGTLSNPNAFPFVVNTDDTRDFIARNLGGTPHPEIVFHLDDSVSYVQNNGNGTFATTNVSLINLGFTGGDLLMADFDLDFDLDLVVCHELGTSVLYCNNSGGNTFNSILPITTSLPDPECLASGDLDGDGDLDLVVGTANGPLVWFKNPEIELCWVERYCNFEPPQNINSTQGTAVIHWIGDLSVSLNNFGLTNTGGPPNKPGIFFYGPNQVAIPFGHGVRCVGGGIFRIRPVVFLGPNGNGALQVDFTNSPMASGPGQILGGSLFNFQFWFRDPNDGPPGFNLSDALQITFCP